MANKLDTSVSVISRYERDEMTPSIDAAKKLAGLLDTTVGYLLGESEDHDLFTDPEMLKRFKDLKHIGAKEREHILFAIDSMLKKVFPYVGSALPDPTRTYPRTMKCKKNAYMF